MKFLLVLAFTLAAGAAPAAILSPIFTQDAAFLAHLAARGAALPANEVAVAQARGGNNARNGDYEAGLHVGPNFTAAPPIGPAGQFSWGSANTTNAFIPFSLSRDGSALAFAMGNYNQRWTDPKVLGIDALGLRLRADMDRATSTDMRLRNLSLGGLALPDLTASDGEIRLMLVQGLAPGNFTLRGEAAADWEGAFPRGSRLGFQIKALDLPTAVPAPAALAVLAFGLVALFLLRRRAA